jgi:hypothetical protein
MEPQASASERWIEKELQVGTWLLEEFLRQRTADAVEEHCFRRHTRSILSSSAPPGSYDLVAIENHYQGRHEVLYRLTCACYQVPPAPRRDIIRTGLEDQRIETACLLAMHKALRNFVNDPGRETRYLEACAPPLPTVKAPDEWKASLFWLQEIMVSCAMNKGMSKKNLHQVAGIMGVLGFEESLVLLLPNVLERDPAGHGVLDKQILHETQKLLDKSMVECALMEGLMKGLMHSPHPAAAGQASGAREHWEPRQEDLLQGGTGGGSALPSAYNAD